MGHFHSRNHLNPKYKNPGSRKNSTVSTISTISKKSSFRYINGRRFHNDENSMYFLPNDDEEGSLY